MRAEVTVQPARGTAGSALRRSAPRENSVSGCSEEEHWQNSRRVLQGATDSGGAPLPSGRKDAGERIEVGDDRGGAYKVPSADAPVQSRQKESSEDSERKRNLKNISFQKSERVLSIFQVRLRFISC